MVTSASALQIYYFLSVLVAATATELQELSPQGSGRRLFSFSQQHEHIWGRCKEWARGNTGCILQDDTSCSNFLSSGPADADLEIKIGGLREPGEQGPMHLQWWAARKSPTEYAPLHAPDSLTSCYVYNNALAAYPKFYDDDFNGGNVEVGADGEAILRFSAPAAFRMSCYIALPHIHLRSCLDDNFASSRRDSIFFTFEGPFFSNSCRANPNLRILGYRYAGDASWIIPGEVQPSKTPEPSQQSTPPPTSSTPPSTSLPTSLPTQAPAQIVDLRIQSAKEALDLDALEFSPIYTCFMQGQFFDQFSSDCVAACPPSTAVEHGQCVKKETSQTSVTLMASWILDIECSAECWKEKKTSTLHLLRLSVADHLDIPFQEASVTVSLLGPASRRLDAPTPEQGRRLEEQQMRLSVVVDSRRVSATQDHAHLQNNFIPAAEDATYHFNLQVNKVVPDHDGTEAPAEAPADPYTPAYDSLEPAVAGTPIGMNPTSELPAVAIICIAAAIVVLGFTFSVFLWCKRRAGAGKQNGTVEGNVATQSGDKIDSTEDTLEKSVDEPEPIQVIAEPIKTVTEVV